MNKFIDFILKNKNIILLSGINTASIYMTNKKFYLNKHEKILKLDNDINSYNVIDSTNTNYSIHCKNYNCCERWIYLW